jgi:hypothetical protein
MPCLPCSPCPVYHVLYSLFYVYTERSIDSVQKEGQTGHRRQIRHEVINPAYTALYTLSTMLSMPCLPYSMPCLPYSLCMSTMLSMPWLPYSIYSALYALSTMLSILSVSCLHREQYRQCAKGRADRA